jgi:hypothetical protein
MYSLWKPSNFMAAKYFKEITEIFVTPDLSWKPVESNSDK